MTKVVKIQHDSLLHKGKRPLFLRLPDQVLPEKAFLELNCVTGILSAGVQIGNALPERVFNRRALRFWINCSLTKDELMSLMDNHIDRFQEILDSFDLDFSKGSSVRGAFGEAGERVIDDLRYELQDLYSEDENYSDEDQDFVNSF